MRKTIAAALLSLSLIAAGTTAASAAPCKDAKGKFIKCVKPAPVKKGPCKDARGKFIKCK